MLIFSYIKKIIFGCAGALLLPLRFLQAALRLRLLSWTQALGVASRGLYSCDARAQLPHNMWHLPGLGFEPASPLHWQAHS